jgi:hypothetical protein
VTFSPSTSALQRRQHLRCRHAVLRGSRVVDAHLDLRRQHLLFDLQVGDARDAWPARARSASAWPRSASRSSPKILMAICERTPESMWSMRCEMGWPTSSAAGRLASRARMSALISSIAARQLGGGLEAHVEFADMHAFRVLVEFRAAAAPPDVRHLGHLLDQHLGLARQRRGLGQA